MGLAYNNDPAFRDQIIGMAQQHAEADEYIKGTYGKDIKAGERFQACSIGCTIYDLNRINGTDIDLSDHGAVAREILGSEDLEFIPRLADTIFENLPDPLHIQWALRWLSAIPAGADPEKLKRALPLFLLRTLDGLPETDVSAVSDVRDVLREWADTGMVDAGAAAEAAVKAAKSAGVAAEAVVFAAAEAAWEAARGAARAAAGAAVKAARSAAREKIANDLIESITESLEA